MKRLTRHYKYSRYVFLKTAALVILINIIMLPSWVKYEKDEANLFHIFLNGEEMGYLGDADSIQEILGDARRELAAGTDKIIYAEGDLSCEASSVLFSEIDSRADIQKRMVENLRKNMASADDESREYVHAYTIKIGDYMANMGSFDDVVKVLQTALDRYQDKDEYVAKLVKDQARELNVLTAEVIAKEEVKEEDEIEPVKSADHRITIKCAS